MKSRALLTALFALSLITYIDRAAISSAKDAMAGEMALNDKQIGMVFGAFALGYALAQIPSGWLADRFGARALLAGVVLLWSALTALTGMLASFAALVAVRFLFGVAEAGAYPGSARAIFEWIPGSRRGIANGILFAGSRLGAALAFPLMAWLLAQTHWRSAFYLLALPGLVWGAMWFAAYRDQPVTMKNAEESGAASVRILSRPVALAMAQYFVVNFTTFLCLSWMQPYLKTRYALSATEAAFYAMIPLLAGAGAHWANGLLIDRLFRGARRDWSRRLPAIAGFLISATGIVCIPSAPTIQSATAFFTVAAFGAEMVISPSWAYCIDIGRTHSGAISGTMNMAGNIGSFLCANLFPLIAAWTGSNAPYFWLVGVLDLCAAGCWLAMRSPPGDLAWCGTAPAMPHPSHRQT